MAQPALRSAASSWSRVTVVRYPGIESSLSSVPPVCPRPRPEIIGTMPPQAATTGASTRLTLSPTPPLECLSRIGPGKPLRQSSTVPERVIASVSAMVSSWDMPSRKKAIAIAAACASLQL
jgi:hypothetical protein